MIAANKSSSAPAPSQSPSSASQQGPFISIGKAARLLGCSVQSLREWEKQGKVSSLRTCGGSRHGQRRFNIADLKAQVLGIQGPEAPVDEEKKSVAIYVRVSSIGQANQGNLERQTERMLTLVAEREGIERDSIRVYSDVASSFGDRKNLNRLMDDVLSGKVSKLLVENMDRLSRVASLTRLVEHLCKSRGVEIVAVDREETNPDELQAGMMELTEFVQCLCARIQGRRSGARKRKVLAPTAIEIIQRDWASGASIVQTVQKLKKLGLKTEKGDVISYRVVSRYRNRVICKLPELDQSEVEHTFADFVGKHLPKKKGGRVEVPAIMNGYRSWCRKQKIEPLSARRMGEWLKDNGYEREVVNGFKWVIDVAMVGYPSLNLASGYFARRHDNGLRAKSGRSE